MTALQNQWLCWKQSACIHTIT